MHIINLRLELLHRVSVLLDYSLRINTEVQGTLPNMMKGSLSLVKGQSKYETLSVKA